MYFECEPCWDFNEKIYFASRSVVFGFSIVARPILRLVL
jgi:hypothetical protein